MSSTSPAQKRSYRAGWRVVIMRRHVYDRILADMREGESRGDVIERWSRSVEGKGRLECSSG